MIIVTGAYGFIGSNLVHALNARGYKDLILVDDLTDGCKWKNLIGADFRSYYDVDKFFQDFDRWPSVRAIYHQGAISSTVETNGKLVMDRNYDFSCKLLDKSLMWGIPVSYASSASVYGNTKGKSLDPLNLYAYSKMLIDDAVQKKINDFKLIHGWRYFNVYGKREDHKGNQASPVTKFRKQLKETGKIQLFDGSSEIYRDFICVEDVVKVVIESMENGLYSGIRDLGTGHCVSFKTVAHQVVRKYGGMIETIPFPEELREGYQYYTRANPPEGFKFTSIANWLDKN